MEASVDPLFRGPDWKPITPKRGSLLHADSHASNALSRFFMVSKSWRSHTQRTPAGETVSPLPQLVGNADLTEGRLLDGERNDGVLDLLRHAVLQHWLLAADFLQAQFAALVVELLEPVEAVAAVAHHLTGLADVAELLGELQQANLSADDL